MKGILKFFHHTKGFGFITGEDGQVYFASYRGMDKKFAKTRISDNTEVVFDPEPGNEKGPIAMNICPQNQT